MGIEENIISEKINREMEKQFVFRYIPFEKYRDIKTISKDDFIGELGGWVVPARIELGGIPLRVKGYRTISKDNPIYGCSCGDDKDFMPLRLLMTGQDLLDAKPTGFVFGYAGFIVLHFSYPSSDKVKISVAKPERLDEKWWRTRVTFGEVPPVIVNRKSAAFEFFKYQNDLFKDAKKYCGDFGLRDIVCVQDDICKDERIKNLFREANEELEVVPEELKKYL